MGGSDYLARGVVDKANVRFSLAETCDTVTAGIFIHDLDPVAAELFGSALTTAVLASPLLDPGERYSFRWEYDGEAGVILADVDAQAKVRGIMRHNHLMAGPTDPHSLFGDGGSVSVVRTADGKLLNSAVAPAGLLDVADDIGYYMSTSDQTETEFAVSLAFSSNPERPLRNACGLMLQALPGCDLALFAVWRSRMKGEAVTAALRSPDIQEETRLSRALSSVFGASRAELGEKWGLSFEFGPKPEYHCACSKEKSRQAALTLGKEGLDEYFAGKSQMKVECDFCHKCYFLVRGDF